MGSGIVKKTAAQATGALERVTNLEDGLENVVKGVNESFTLIESRLQTLEELVTALTVTVGTEQVQDMVLTNRKVQQDARIEAAKASIATAVTEGKLLPATLPSLAEMEADTDNVLVNKFLVVGREMNAEGEVLPPGRLQLPLGRIMKEVRVLLAGAGPGLTVPTPQNQQFVLDEVYVENPNPPVPDNFSREHLDSPKAQAAE